MRKHQGSRRLALLASILLSFAFGAGLATLAYTHAHRLAMFPPVLFLLWIIAQDLRRPIAEIEPAEITADLGLELPPGLLVVHLKHDSDRPGAVQRLPDLMAWLDRLPPTARVIVLDLDKVTRMDEDSALELRAALRRSKAEGRRLILAGISPAEFRELSKAGPESLDPLSACTDLELAIARGMGLLAHLDGETAPKV
jgi:anti-anti-sigma regulatory factor